jgi:hypothetical protein
MHISIPENVDPQAAVGVPPRKKLRLEWKDKVRGWIWDCI